MGYGDDVLASGLARASHDRGDRRRVAFGNGKRIIWGPWSEEVFRYNPRIAKPTSVINGDLQWIAHYKGSRLYNRLSPDGRRWVWNRDFRAVAGEIFFRAHELAAASAAGSGFVLIEPNVPWHKSVASNKDWGLANYQAVADRLMKDGHDVVQSNHGRLRLRGARVVSTPTFRDALAVLSRARAALVPEGGLHHGAAAVGVPAVVIFGGFIPPSVMGYEHHVNMTGGVEACGSLNQCQHCKEAMQRISVEKVHQAVAAIVD
jgi:Glycosyltransferase family 9 (heptosyltransferase)